MKEIALRHMKALLLLLAVSACLSACSSEGPGEEGEVADQSDLIIGAWIQRLRNGDYYEMEFWPSGGGTFDSNVGWTGTFRWKITSPGVMHLNMLYFGERSATRDEYNVHFRIKEDTLYFDGDKYVRNSPPYHRI